MKYFSTRHQALAILQQLGNHQCTVIENDSTALAAKDSERARIYVDDARFYSAVLADSNTIARAYIDGWWHTPDLYALMQLAAENIDTLNSRLDHRWRVPLLLSTLLAAARRRLFSRKSARNDIAAHYDLGNDFFSLFLDETMAYSCALFPDLNASGSDQLAAASRHKLNRICDKLELTADDTLLDMGCGWGSMMLHAAATRGCKTTGITLSAAQEKYLNQQAAVTDGPAAVVLGDYRDFQPRQKFSKLSSVEMIEAAGEKHFTTYFRRIRDLLADNGLAQVQAIMIPDTRYRFARNQDDFIRRYIFPGGKLPALGIIRQAAHSAGLQLINTEDISSHYPPTLLAWRARFNQQRDAIKTLGFSEKFCRIWEYYFCYCAGAFSASALSVAQLVFAPMRK